MAAAATAQAARDQDGGGGRRHLGNQDGDRHLGPLHPKPWPWGPLILAHESVDKKVKPIKGEASRKVFFENKKIADELRKPKKTKPKKTSPEAELVDVKLAAPATAARQRRRQSVMRRGVRQSARLYDVRAEDARS